MLISLYLSFVNKYKFYILLDSNNTKTKLSKFLEEK